MNSKTLTLTLHTHRLMTRQGTPEPMTLMAGSHDLNSGSHDRHETYPNHLFIKHN